MTLTQRIQSLIFILFTFIISSQLVAQCTNAFAFVTLTAPTTTTPTTFSTCNWAGDYNIVNSVVAGETYSFDDGVGGCITIHSGSASGPVVAFGSAPLSWTAGTSGTFYIHYNTNCVGCGTGISCLNTTITCTSCGGGGGGAGPCASITPIIGCGTSNAVSLTGPGVWDLGICGFSTPGIESIWSFTATSTGIHSLDITSISGGFIDFMWIDATSGCGAAAPWNCISDIFLTGNYGSMNWTAGNTYYILIDPETTGATTVIFDLNCPNVGPVTAGDCATAIPVCTNLSFAIDPNGYGAIDELCVGCISNPSTNPASGNFGCLNSGELNSTWFTVNVAVGGMLEFSFGAPGSGNCYDWIMWPMTGTICADIIGNTAPPVRCNWNGICDGFTGIAGTLPAGGIASEFEPALAVSTGDQFLICFSNYSSALTTVPLDFFGTADISCLPLPVEMTEFTGVDLGGYNELNWTTASEVNCDKFEIQRSSTGVDFEVIGIQDGAGTSLEVTNYRFVDYSPDSEMNYYRLKQYDMNGAFVYSKIIAISQKESVELSVLNASPNPAKEILVLQLVSPIQGELSIGILSMNGTVQRMFKESIQKGGNDIAIPVAELPIGMYLIALENEVTGEREMVRFVKN